VLAPVAYSLAVLGDLATAVILIATWRATPPRRSTLVLILSFSSNALLLLAAALTLPLVQTVPPVVQAPGSFGIWIFVCWHVVAALGALAYVAVRDDEARIEPSRRFALKAIGATLLLDASVIFVALRFGDQLPRLANHTSVAGLASTGVGPFAIVLVGLAAVFTFRLARPSVLERALALSLVALAAELTIFMVGGHRYTTTYYLGRVLVLAAGVFVFVAAMQTLVTARLKLAETEGAVAALAGESEKRAGRINAIWEIASQAQHSEAERARAVLAIATGAMRPGKPMMGFLYSLEAETITIEEVIFAGFGSRSPLLQSLVYPGVSFAYAETMAYLLARHERAKAWDDLRGIRRKGMVATELDIQSFIGAKIEVAGRVYFVSFASPEPMFEEPFAEDDLAYVEVVAAFFASRFEKQQQFKMIRFEIEHDALTGLTNRVQFHEAAREELRGEKPFALAFIDIDGFRHINGREGYQVADAVLVEVARGLAGIAQNDLVGRMGADLFAVLLRGAESRESIVRAVESYADLFRRPMRISGADGGRTLPIGASIGVVAYPADGQSLEDLIRRADFALGVAKTVAGTNASIFEASMDSIVAETALRVSELAEAIAGDQLALAYQPTFDLATRSIVGAEALVRWDHPVRGRLPPSEFIDFAERNDLIGPLTFWVFGRVARDLASRADWPAGFRIYFNVAARMLEDVPFITMLDEALRASPQLAGHLGIEVTESAAMQNVERSMTTIDLFRRLGVSVAIDDFGTGHSSLSYLKHLIVDVIKIDRSFVTGLPGDDRDNAIVEMMLRITDQLGFASLAEGIETEAQLSWLREHGCRFGQGYLVAKPAAFEILLERLQLTSSASRFGRLVPQNASLAPNETRPSTLHGASA
jgi:diguanylate cyclase (GGDEF)-like protein